MNNLMEKIDKSILNILETETFAQLYSTILEEIKKITEIDSGIILLDADGRLKRIASSNFPPKIKISKSDKIYGVLMNDKVEIVDNDKLRGFSCLKHEKSPYTIFLPLVYHRDGIGIIILFSKTDPGYANKDLSLLHLFAATVSIIIMKFRLRSELQNALDTRDRFISLASHELRTPLTSLNGYVQLLHRKLAKQDTPESRWVKELYEETSRLTSLIKELLDINRIRQGQLDFILHEVNLIDVINKAIERFHFVNSDNKIEFSNLVKNGKSLIIGDFNKLLQMVTALLSNASKFSKPNSKIQITLSANTKYLNIKVIDQGSGIPKKELSKILNGFYKIGTDEKEGLGVGLLLAEHIIHHHRGKIKIKSKENKGTTIEVQLPQIKF